MSHVFVSYARADYARVARYVERLRSSGFLVRWDEDLRGQAIDAQLKQWIDEASAIVVFWSFAATSRNFVLAEVNHADISRVVNVQIDPIDLKSIPLKANTRNVIDLSASNSLQDSDGLLKLIARCAELSGIAPAPGHRDRQDNSDAAAPVRSAPSFVVGVNNGIVADTISGPITFGGARTRR